ncbi:hypothetical protein [Roseibium sp. MMSF_3544]|uniref:hypothetical protein n=1 Tax=unclassified Roseibium TaxID=2629323 RepID=UPI00273E2AED|nr:hypothetical protein [Roseibium sp. MMSF_3544]
MKSLFRDMVRWSSCFGTLALLASPASATSNMFCDGIDSGVEVNILFGAGPVLTIIDVTLSTETQYFSTQKRDGATPAWIARDFADDDMVKVDLIDDQASDLIASIRVVRSDDEEPYQIGYVQLTGSPTMGVTCVGP